MAGPIRIGIVGLGKMGRIRLDTIRRNPVDALSGLCNRSPVALDGFPSVPFFTDYRDLLDEDLDAVVVATPNQVTPEIVIAALGKGFHVFAEKPPGRTLADIRAIQKAEQEHPGLNVKFGFNHRYHDAVMEAKALVQSGEIGEVLWMRGIYGKAGGPGFEKGWRSDREIAGGGILLDQGIHMLDLFRYFCGDFGEVKSMVATSFWPIGVEDNAFALLRNGRGQIAIIHSSTTQWRHTFLLETCLTRGLVTVSGILSSTRSYGFAERLIVARREDPEHATAFGNPPETVTTWDRDLSWEREMNEFGRSILTGAPPVHGTTEDALKVMELVEAVYRGDPATGGKKRR